LPGNRNPSTRDAEFVDEAAASGADRGDVVAVRAGEYPVVVPAAAATAPARTGDCEINQAKYHEKRDGSNTCEAHENSLE
jgi:hypothetical protein